MRLLHLAAALTVVMAAGAPAASAQGRPDCATIVRQMHRITGHDGAGTPDSSALARKLGTDSAWVERCAHSYGRRVKKQPREPGESDEGLTAPQEAREYDEVAREERDQQANRVRGNPENSKGLDRVRGVDPDSSAEWEPFITHEWEPYVTHEWAPFIPDDDHPGEE
jgi:hypothetical protein